MLRTRHCRRARTAAITGLAPRALTLLTIVLSSAQPAAAEQIPLPVQAQAVEPSVSLRINGLPTRIRSFEVALPLAAVAQRYRDWLGTPRIDTRIGDWTVLSRLHSGTLQTIRLREAGASVTIGTLSEGAVDELPGALGNTEFAPPADRLATLELAMRDEGRDARFLVWQSPRSLQASARQLRAALGARGYQLQHSLPVSESGQRGLGLWFRGAQGEATAILVATPASTAVSLSIVQPQSATAK